VESSLHHATLTEGAALYRDIRERRARWREALGGNNRTATATAGSQPSPFSKRLSSPLHAYYPFLFHTFFQDVPMETVRELARADRFYTGHLLAYDRILDRGLSTDTAGLFLAQLEHMQSLKRLYSLFPAGHAFWDYFHDCYSETWKSVREERLYHAYRLGAFSMARFCSLARGKTALLRPFSMALAFLSERTEHLPRLSVSLDQHHIALVLVDDLEDWRQDYRNCNFTYLLTRLIRKAGLTDQILSGRSVSAVRVGRLLYTTGLMEKQLRLAEIFFQRSNETVGTLPLPLWKQFNNGFRIRCRALRHDLAEIRRREEGRARMRESVNRASANVPGKSILDASTGQIRSGVRFLARSQTREGGFPLSRSPHAYMCPSESVAPSRFVTTLILRSLRPVGILASSVTPLFLSASNWLRDMEGTNPDPGLPVTLERAFAPIPSGRDHLSHLDRTFAPAYGPLPDGLFWANFLYTCSETSLLPPRLSAYVTDCFLRKDYTPWSFGVTFGPVASPWTRYVSRPLLPLLLFCQALGKSLPREALQGYLLETYRTAGSWLNTTEIALTLLCLLLTAYDGPELVPAITKLGESQEPDGSWAPNAVFQEGAGYYGSRELTTAWCLEALYRYHIRPVRSSQEDQKRRGSSSWAAVPC
jgi:hypothetical protein